MASTEAKAQRRAHAIARLDRAVRRFGKLYDIEVPDVTGQRTPRDPELARIEMIEGMADMLNAILRKADPTPEAEEEAAERDARLQAEREAEKVAREAERERAREERTLFGGRPDLTTETDERVAEVSEALESGEAVPAAPLAGDSNADTTTTTEDTEMPKNATVDGGARKPGNPPAGKKLSK